MTYKNYLNTFRAIVKIRLGKRIPIKVYHYTTSKCNLNCCFCLADDIKKQKDMSTEQIKECMNEFKAMGTQIWGFGGGEPMMRKDIEELVDHAKSIGFFVSTTTNGTIIQDRLGVLKKFNLVFVSVDGPQKVHNKIRGAKCFKKIIGNIDIMVENRIRPIINFVVCSDNYKHLRYMANLAKQHKCRIDYSIIVANLEKIDKFTLTPEQTADAVSEIRKLKKEYPEINCPEPYLDQTEKFSRGETRVFQQNCLAGRAFCALSPSGEVALCTEMFGKGHDGAKLGFKNAFNKLKYPGCDCTFRCYYNNSRLYDLKFLTLAKAATNLIRGRWIHN